jgi:hypothetical protein
VEHHVKLLVLVENITLGGKWLTMTNTLAYYIVVLITLLKFDKELEIRFSENLINEN